MKSSQDFCQVKTILRERKYMKEMPTRLVPKYVPFSGPSRPSLTDSTRISTAQVPYSYQPTHLLLSNLLTESEHPPSPHSSYTASQCGPPARSTQRSRSPSGCPS